ncbi:MAG: cofE [Mycetocola sp.]|nr:cofE [Mycetocola sp.]
MLEEEFSVRAVPGIPEIRAGDDLVTIIAATAGSLADGDILVVSSKIVSKAEGRLRAADDREQAITDETVRVVATRRRGDGELTRIVENRLGIVQAAAGVDGSNVPDGHVLLLPVDPDASARRLVAAFRDRGLRIGVVISDTLGRPWRVGQTDAAIGAAGVTVVRDLRGTTDAGGRPLGVTLPAVADELAAAADLVKGKADARPVAVIRGLGSLVTGIDAPGARALIRDAEQDMFRLGSDEAYDEGYRDGYDAGFAEASRDDGS